MTTWRNCLNSREFVYTAEIRLYTRTRVDRCTPVLRTYYLNKFFSILHTLSVMIFIYSGCKSCSATIKLCCNLTDMSIWTPLLPTISFSLLRFLKKKTTPLRLPYNMSVLSQVLNHWTNFHEIWDERYAIRGYLNSVIFNFLQSVTAAWRTHELVRWKRHKCHWIYSAKMMYGNMLKKCGTCLRHFFL